MKNGMAISMLRFSGTEKKVRGKIGDNTMFLAHRFVIASRGNWVV
jgi:hypothetical protein